MVEPIQRASKHKKTNCDSIGPERKQTRICMIGNICAYLQFLAKVDWFLELN